jgi:hypothetical protein
LRQWIGVSWYVALRRWIGVRRHGLGGRLGRHSRDQVGRLGSIREKLLGALEL